MKTTRYRIEINGVTHIILADDVSLDGNGSLTLRLENRTVAIYRKWDCIVEMDATPGLTPNDAIKP